MQLLASFRHACCFTAAPAGWLLHRPVHQPVGRLQTANKTRQLEAMQQLHRPVHVSQSTTLCLQATFTEHVTLCLQAILRRRLQKARQLQQRRPVQTGPCKPPAAPPLPWKHSWTAQLSPPGRHSTLTPTPGPVPALQPFAAPCQCHLEPDKHTCCWLTATSSKLSV